MRFYSFKINLRFIIIIGRVSPRHVTVCEILLRFILPGCVVFADAKSITSCCNTAFDLTGAGFELQTYHFPGERFIPSTKRAINLQSTVSNFLPSSMHIVTIVITSLYTTLPWPGDSKGLYPIAFESSCHLLTCLPLTASKCSFKSLTSSRKADR